MNTEIRKPPIGLIPKYMWEEQRFNDVCQAILRYSKEGFHIPIEWIEEYNELVLKINK